MKAISLTEKRLEGFKKFEPQPGRGHEPQVKFTITPKGIVVMNFSAAAVDQYGLGVDYPSADLYYCAETEEIALELRADRQGAKFTTTTLTEKSRRVKMVATIFFRQMGIPSIEGRRHIRAYGRALFIDLSTKWREEKKEVGNAVLSQ